MKNRILVLFLTLLSSVAFCELTVAEDALLKMSDTGWKYYDAADAPAKEWNSADFDDAAWKSGPAPLGYGDDDIKQLISFGDDEQNKRLCAYFRHAFEVKDLSSAKAFVGTFICDDACVFYINGQEAHRFNLAEGEVTDESSTKFTMGGEAERYALTFFVSADKLKEGKNVLAVRVHQAAAASSDLAIDVSLEGLADDAAVEKAKLKIKADEEMIKTYQEQSAQ